MWQPWLVKAWELLAREGWKLRAAPDAYGTAHLRVLTLLALGQSSADQAGGLIGEWFKSPPKAATFAEFQEQRGTRFSLLEQARLTETRPDLRRSVLAPFASWEGLCRDWSAAGVPAGEAPPGVRRLQEWIDGEKQRARALLVALPQDEREKAVAFQKQTVREFLELWFKERGENAQSAALAWLWAQPAQEFLDAYAESLDAWARVLREQFGLDVRVDPRAPLVLSLPPAEKGESLRSYLANRLAAGEIWAAGLEQGQRVLLQRIGGEAAGGKPLDAHAALELPVFNLGGREKCVPELRDALLLRGIQLVSPEVDLKFDHLPLRQAVYWIAKLLNRGVRVEVDTIEVK